MYKNVVLLCGKGESSNILYHFLCENGIIPQVISEDDVPRSVWIRRRVKKMGWFRVLGQLMFLIFIVPLLKISSRKRKSEIIQRYRLNITPIPQHRTLDVPSVNSDICIEQLKVIAPNLIMVNGTRIIAQKVLESVDAPFVNIHAGITPYYRGVHGAYWALIQNEPHKCGVTIHLVDKGIDTGGILAQSTIQPTDADNFTTYPLLQLGEGLSKLMPALSALAEGKAAITKRADKGKLFYHPSIWEYCRYYIQRGKR